MATKQSSSDGKHTFASLLLVVLFGLLAVLALVPIDIFQAVRAREQLQIVNWFGQETDQWIMDKIFEVLTWMNTEAGQLMEASAASGVQKIGLMACPARLCRNSLGSCDSLPARHDFHVDSLALHVCGICRRSLPTSDCKSIVLFAKPADA